MSGAALALVLGAAVIHATRQAEPNAAYASRRMFDRPGMTFPSIVIMRIMHSR